MQIYNLHIKRGSIIDLLVELQPSLGWELSSEELMVHDAMSTVLASWEEAMCNPWSKRNTVFRSKNIYTENFAPSCSSKSPIQILHS
jgi:hypothetical protein